MGIEKNGRSTVKKTKAKPNQQVLRPQKKKGPTKRRTTKRVPKKEPDPPELTPEERWENILADCKRSGHFMLVAYHINGTQVRLYRRTVDFPPEDFETALDLLEADLAKEKDKLAPGRAKLLGRLDNED